MRSFEQISDKIARPIYMTRGAFNLSVFNALNLKGFFSPLYDEIFVAGIEIDFEKLS